MQQPVIIVHSFAHARAALTAAVAQSRSIVFLSAPDAGMQSGPAWFHTMIEQAKDAVPGAERIDVTEVLDCGDMPGTAMAALRYGFTRICFTGAEKPLEKLRDIAEQKQAVIMTERPDGLDLLGIADPKTCCRDWLSNRSD